MRNRVVARRIQDGLSGGLVSSCHLHHAIALFITLIEARTFGREYGLAAIQNARSLGLALQNNGVNVFVDENGVCTESHVILIRCEDEAESHHFSSVLLNAGIAVNARRALGEHVIRIGTQEITRLGVDAEEANLIGTLIADLLCERTTSQVASARVTEMMQSHERIVYGFDMVDGISDLVNSGPAHTVACS